MMEHFPVRRRCPPELPSLKEIFNGSDSATTNSAAVHALLKRIAIEKQNDDLQPFYSMRAVADHFHIPTARVSRIYHRLSSERLLRMVWGSKTLLEPLKSSRSSGCRSIGITVDLRRFLGSSDYRASILSLQSEVWNHEVNDHVLFFETEPGEVVSLCTRRHHPHMNTIVWLLPEPSDSPTILRLHDLGFRVVCLSSHRVLGIPDCYAISRSWTIRAIVRKKILNI